MCRKIYFIFILFLVSSSLGHGQDKGFIISPKLSFGLGTIKSENFNKSYEEISAAFINNGYRIKVENNYGFNVALGLSLQYSFSESIAVVTEPAMGWFNSPYNFTLQNINIQLNENILQRVENKINIKYFSVPLLLKYKLLQDYSFYFLAGLNLDFITDARIDTRSIAPVYAVHGSTMQYLNIPVDGAKLKGFSNTRFSLVGGIGAPIPLILDKRLNINIRYHLPLTKSEMYTKSEANEKATVFTFTEKEEIEKAYPQYKLNDFKMSTISISLSLDVGKY